MRRTDKLRRYHLRKALAPYRLEKAARTREATKAAEQESTGMRDRAGLRASSLSFASGLSLSPHLGAQSDLVVPDPPNLSGLAPWQPAGVLFLREHSRALLADDMGLGKTVQVLRAWRRRQRAIVCCPASVAVQWRDEVRKFRPDLSPVLADLRRPGPGEVLITSYDSLPEPPMHGEGLIAAPLEDVCGVFDECQMVKNPSADRTVRARLLGRQLGTLWGLSATPMPGTPLDLWGVLETLELAEATFGTRERFLELCAGRRVPGRGWTWGEISPEVRAALRKGAVLRREARLLRLPALRFADLPVAAPEDIREFLDGAKSAWRGVAQDELPPAELLAPARAALARSRIPAAIEWLETRASAECPFLVFSAHVDPVVAIGAMAGAGAFTGATARSERSRAVEAFMRGDLRILAMTIDAGGVGLNLQRAAGVLFVDRSYVPSQNRQALARAYRKGQRRSVLCVRMVSDHPLDRRLQVILDGKEERERAAFG